MYKFKLLFIGSLFCFSCYSTLQAQSSRTLPGNPMIPDMIADPSICVFDGMFYCYATTDGYSQGLATSGPPVVWKSKDFVNWSFSGIFFPSAKGQLYWAPSKAIKANGKYYLYPTINTDIFAAVAESPDGPFRLATGIDSFKSLNSPKPMLKLKGPKGTKGIDAEVFIDDDGQAYMFWAQRGAAKLNADMVTLDTAIVNIPTRRKGYSEGPMFFKRKGIYYYLYTLGGHEKYQYAYMMSKTSPLGPYEFAQNDIIATTDHEKGIYGPGHGCVFSMPETDQFYFVYLEFGRGSTTRQIWADKLEFNDDGTIKPVVLTHDGVGALSRLPKDVNLALKGNASASGSLPGLKVKPVKDTALHRTETYLPVNAIDGLYGTRWMAPQNDTTSWLMIDLGKVQKLKRSEVYFVKPTAGHAYFLEASADGKKWLSCGGHDDVKIQSPHSDALNLKARYLRIRILKGEQGIWEWKVE